MFDVKVVTLKDDNKEITKKVTLVRTPLKGHAQSSVTFFFRVLHFSCCVENFSSEMNWFLANMI